MNITPETVVTALRNALGGSPEAETVEVPVGVVVIAWDYIFPKRNTQLSPLIKEDGLRLPERNNGRLVLTRECIAALADAIAAGVPVGKKNTTRVTLAGWLHSFTLGTSQRIVPIPAGMWAEILPHLEEFKWPEKTDNLQAPPDREFITADRWLINAIVDFLDPSGAGERAKGRQAAAVAISEELHKHTREQQGRTIKTPPELVRLTLLYLPEGGYAWLEEKLNYLDRRGRVRIPRQRVYDLCDTLHPAGIRGRKRASRAAWEERRRGGKGRRKQVRRQQGPKTKKREKGSPLQPSRRASRAEMGG